MKPAIISPETAVRECEAARKRRRITARTGMAFLIASDGTIIRAVETPNSLNEETAEFVASKMRRSCSGAIFLTWKEGKAEKPDGSDAEKLENVKTIIQAHDAMVWDRIILYRDGFYSSAMDRTMKYDKKEASHE